MDRSSFRKLFKTGNSPAILPVIHVQNNEQTKRNVDLVQQEGAQGVFLINHDFSYTQLLPVIKEIRSVYPYLWIGVNFLGTTGAHAFPVLGQLAKEGTVVDAYWADNACIDERKSLDDQKQAQHIDDARKASGWNGLYFGGTAFKMQRHVADGEVGKAASVATRYMDAVTTSGSATGVAAHVQKIKDMRVGCRDTAMALASGVTPENASQYAPLVDAILVATGISKPGDFYNLDPIRLRALISVCRSQALVPISPNPPAASNQPWYLSLIAPNTKGEKFAWLDPSSLYMDSKAFSKIVDDLMSHFKTEDFDIVVGIDAMGFPLAAAIAIKAGKGLLTARKGGKLCVSTDEVPYECYSGPGHILEMRTDAFKSGTRVLIVDQWIETGGTMQAAIDLVERQGGVVAGCATIAVETKPKTKALCEKYKVVHVIPPHLQQEFDEHRFLAANMT